MKTPKWKWLDRVLGRGIYAEYYVEELCAELNSLNVTVNGYIEERAELKAAIDGHYKARAKTEQLVISLRGDLADRRADYDRVNEKFIAANVKLHKAQEGITNYAKREAKRSEIARDLALRLERSIERQSATNDFVRNYYRTYISPQDYE